MAKIKEIWIPEMDGGEIMDNVDDTSVKEVEHGLDNDTSASDNPAE